MIMHDHEPFVGDHILNFIYAERMNRNTCNGPWPLYLEPTTLPNLSSLSPPYMTSDGNPVEDVMVSMASVIQPKLSLLPKLVIDYIQYQVLLHWTSVKWQMAKSFNIDD